MILILLASLLAVAIAAPEAQVPTAKSLIPTAPTYAYPQTLQSQYYNPQQYYGRGYDQYYRGGYRPYEQNYYRGQYDPSRYYNGQYDRYSGQYDRYSGQYDRYYNGQYDRYNGQYDNRYYNPYETKYYKPETKYYKPQVNPDLKYQYTREGHIPILEQSSEVNPDGTFRYSYATADGQQAHAEGFVRKSEIDPQDDSNVIKGEFSYTSPDGTPVQTAYIADEYGFRAEGTHVPKVPIEIQRSLEYNAQYDKQPNEYQRYYKPQVAYNPYTKPVVAVDSAVVPQK